MYCRRPYPRRAGCGKTYRTGLEGPYPARRNDPEGPYGPHRLRRGPSCDELISYPVGKIQNNASRWCFSDCILQNPAGPHYTSRSQDALNWSACPSVTKNNVDWNLSPERVLTKGEKRCTGPNMRDVGLHDKIRQDYDLALREPLPNSTPSVSNKSRYPAFLFPLDESLKFPPSDRTSSSCPIQPGDNVVQQKQPMPPVPCTPDPRTYATDLGANYQPFDWLRWRRRAGPVVQLRLLVKGKNVGAIVGKQGANFKRVQREYTPLVSLKVAEPRRPDAVLSVTADLGLVSELLLDLVPYLECLVDLTRDSELRMLLPENRTGQVIGKGGKHVRELQQANNCKILLYQMACPRSTERVLSVSGRRPVDVVNCLADILSLLARSPAPAATACGGLGGAEVIPYDPQWYDEALSEQYGGYGVDDVQCRDLCDPSEVNAPIRFIWLDENSMRVSLLKELYTAVLGRRGSTVKELRSASGAKITIDQPPARSPVRTLTIVGTQNQISAAQILIQMRYMKTLCSKLACEEGAGRIGEEGPEKPRGRKRKRPLAEWITPQMSANKTLRRRLERQWLASKASGDLERIESAYKAYRDQMQLCSKETRLAKNAWEREHGIVDEKKAAKHRAHALKIAARVAGTVDDCAASSAATGASNEAKRKESIDSAATSAEGEEGDSVGDEKWGRGMGDVKSPVTEGAHELWEISSESELDEDEVEEGGDDSGTES